MAFQTKTAGTVNTSSNGTDSVVWVPTGTNKTDAETQDGVETQASPWHAIVVAMVVTDYEGVNTYKLSFTNFGFSLPATDIVTGITVTLKHRQTSSRYAGTDITDQTIQLIGLPAPDGSSSNKADGTALPTSLTLKSYGSTPYKTYWGLTVNLTGADINASGFGFDLAYKGTPYTPSTIGAATPIPFVPSVFLDYLEITVTTVAGGIRPLAGDNLAQSNVIHSKVIR